MELGVLLQGGVYLLLFLAAAAYLSYMIGLIAVLKRLDRLSWQAFVPIFNYYAQVRAVGAPGRWFFYSLIPYIGFAYVGTIALRLGAIFGKKASFSLFWLTFGASFGMHVIARSPTFDEDLYHQPIKLVDVRALRRRLRGRKN